MKIPTTASKLQRGETNMDARSNIFLNPEKKKSFCFKKFSGSDQTNEGAPQTPLAILVVTD